MRSYYPTFAPGFDMGGKKDPVVKSRAKRVFEVRRISAVAFAAAATDYPQREPLVGIPAVLLERWRLVAAAAAVVVNREEAPMPRGKAAAAAAERLVENELD